MSESKEEYEYRRFVWDLEHPVSRYDDNVIIN